MSKPFKNILTHWQTTHITSDMRVRGRAVFDQPSIGVSAGNSIITSPIVRIYIDEEKRRVLETQHSLYILREE